VDEGYSRTEAGQAGWVSRVREVAAGLAVDCFGAVPLDERTVAAVQADGVVVAVRRTGAESWALSVRHGWAGAEVARLCQSFSTPAGVQQAARAVVALVGSGSTVARVADLLGVGPEPERVYRVQPAVAAGFGLDAPLTQRRPAVTVHAAGMAVAVHRVDAGSWQVTVRDRDGADEPPQCRSFPAEASARQAARAAVALVRAGAAVPQVTEVIDLIADAAGSGTERGAHRGTRSRGAAEASS